MKIKAICPDGLMLNWTSKGDVERGETCYGNLYFSWTDASDEKEHNFYPGAASVEIIGDK